jgi:hypothetical protein
MIKPHRGLACRCREPTPRLGLGTPTRTDTDIFLLPPRRTSGDATSKTQERAVYRTLSMPRNPVAASDSQVRPA